MPTYSTKTLDQVRHEGLSFVAQGNVHTLYEPLGGWPKELSWWTLKMLYLKLIFVQELKGQRYGYKDVDVSYFGPNSCRVDANGTVVYFRSAFDALRYAIVEHSVTSFT